MKKLLLLLLLLPITVKAFETNGECTILMDMNSNRILFADDIHKVRSIASITNIMTT